MPTPISKEALEQAQLVFQDGLKCLQEGDVDNADLLFAKAHGLDPKNIDALNLLGIREYQKQNYQRAIDFLSTGHRLHGNSAYTLNNLGLAYNALKEFQKALEYLDLAVAIDPGLPEAHNNRGNALKGLHQNGCALEAYQYAIQIQPEYAEAISNQGVIFLEEKKYQKAIQSFEGAIQLNPYLASAYNNLGNVYTATNQYEAAFQAFNHAIQLNPQYLDACLNFGISLKKAKGYIDSIKCLEYAAQLNPEYAKTYFLLGEVFFDVGDTASAKMNFCKSLSLMPQNLESQFALTIAQIPKVYLNPEELGQSRTNFSKALNILEDFKSHNASPEDIAANIGRHPFYLAYQEKTNTALLNQYGDICTELAKPIHDNLQKLKLITSKKVDKIRIGIVSHYFYDHPVWHAITKGWIKHLNPKLFEIHIFNTNGPEDQETQIAKNMVTSYSRTNESTLDMATYILNMQLNILLYPEIGMDAGTKSLACLRLAPIQAVSWGHPETTGLSTIDYFLSGEVFEPKNSKDNYRERLATLSGSGTYFELEKIIPTELDLSGLGIDASRPILLCAGSPSKYSPLNDEVLIKIAQRLGNCQFIFFCFQKELAEILKGRLYNAFTKAKLQPEKFIIFIPFLKKDQFFSLMLKADLYLDTIGFSGFNSAMQAISCDLPVITVEGQFMRGRLASGILKNIGLDELVCKTNEGYADIVVKLAQNKPLLQIYREKICRSKYSIFNNPRPIKDLEKFLVNTVYERN